MASALTYLHSFQLVHGSVIPANILIFRPNLSLVKLTDFGSTCRSGTFVRRHVFSGPYTPPELSKTEGAEGYYTGTSLDTWALGVLIINCLTGNKPWSTSDVSDPEYAAFRSWQRAKSIRVPRPFKRFTCRLLRLIRRLLEPRGWSRYPAKEVFKYLDDDWLIKSRDRSDSHDFDQSLVPLQKSLMNENVPKGQHPKEPEDHEKQTQERVSSPRRFFAELLRFSSPNASMRHHRKSHAWHHHHSSSSSSSSSFTWLNSSSSASSFSTSTNYSSV